MRQYRFCGRLDLDSCMKPARENEDVRRLGQSKSHHTTLLEANEKSLRNQMVPLSNPRVMGLSAG